MLLLQSAIASQDLCWTITAPSQRVLAWCPLVACRKSRIKSHPKSLGSSPSLCGRCQQYSTQVAWNQAVGAWIQILQTAQRTLDTEVYSSLLAVLIRKDEAPYSTEFKFNPRWFKSWPMASPATSGLSLRTVANNPASPNRSSSLICGPCPCSGVVAGESGKVPP